MKSRVINEEQGMISFPFGWRLTLKGDCESPGNGSNYDGRDISAEIGYVIRNLLF